jgi:hypothetical protein
MSQPASSSQLTVYDSTALAAGALHNDMVCAGKSELRGICNILTPNSEAVVKFLVVADLAADANAQIYHAATVSLKVLSNTRMAVSATIGAYVTGNYQNRVRVEELEDGLAEAARPSCRNAAIVPADETSNRNIVVMRHPIITRENEAHLDSMEAQSRCPQALEIVEAVKRIFQRGVPLPCDERFHYCSFTVMVNIPNSLRGIQYLSVLRGTRGTQDTRSVSRPWVSTGVQSGSQKDQELSDKFDQLRLEANGARPSELPGNALQISSTSQRVAMKALPPANTASR